MMATWCEWLNDGDCIVNEDVFMDLIAMREWIEKEHKEIYEMWKNERNNL